MAKSSDAPTLAALASSGDADRFPRPVFSGYSPEDRLLLLPFDEFYEAVVPAYNTDTKIAPQSVDSFERLGGGSWLTQRRASIALQSRMQHVEWSEPRCDSLMDQSSLMKPILTADAMLAIERVMRADTINLPRAIEALVEELYRRDGDGDAIRSNSSLHMHLMLHAFLLRGGLGVLAHCLSRQPIKCKTTESSHNDLAVLETGGFLTFMLRFALDVHTQAIAEYAGIMEGLVRLLTETKTSLKIQFRHTIESVGSFCHLPRLQKLILEQKGIPALCSMSIIALVPGAPKQAAAPVETPLSANVAKILLKLAVSDNERLWQELLACNAQRFPIIGGLLWSQMARQVWLTCCEKIAAHHARPTNAGAATASSDGPGVDVKADLEPHTLAKIEIDTYFQEVSKIIKPASAVVEKMLDELFMLVSKLRDDHTVIDTLFATARVFLTCQASGWRLVALFVLKLTSKAYGLPLDVVEAGDSADFAVVRRLMQALISCADPTLSNKAQKFNQDWKQAPAKLRDLCEVVVSEHAYQPVIKSHLHLLPANVLKRLRPTERVMVGLSERYQQQLHGDLTI